ncbi:MAG: Hsp20 family protein [Maricaulaceae bacterium]|jgi:molecular chaperone IbpA
MRTFDLSPLYGSLVGIDRVSDLLNTAARFDSGSTYPPFNIEETGENAYRIELAVAGFSEADIDIEVNDSTLVVSGRKTDEAERKYLHHGIALRAFERRFQLADHVEVRGARLENGLLSIDLEREIPERLKPRKIAIAGEQPAKRVTTIEPDTADAA